MLSVGEQTGLLPSRSCVKGGHVRLQLPGCALRRHDVEYTCSFGDFLAVSGSGHSGPTAAAARTAGPVLGEKQKSSDIMPTTCRQRDNLPPCIPPTGAVWGARRGVLEWLPAGRRPVCRDLWTASCRPATLYPDPSSKYCVAWRQIQGTRLVRALGAASSADDINMPFLVAKTDSTPGLRSLMAAIVDWRYSSSALAGVQSRAAAGSTGSLLSREATAQLARRTLGWLRRTRWDVVYPPSTAVAHQSPPPAGHRSP